MMEAIPFVGQQASDYEPLGGASPVAMNIISDGNGVIRKRPGIAPYPRNVPGMPAIGSVLDANGLDGLYVTTHGQLFAVGSGVAERPIYSVTSLGSAKVGGGLPPAGLRGTKRPVFAETEMLLVIAGGDLMEKVVLASSTADRLGGSPPNASHVIAMANRLLANDVLLDRSAVRFTDTFGGLVSYAGAEQWAYGGFGTSGYFTAQARPDDVQALVETTSEAHVMGTTSIQIFQPDPDVTFAPVIAVEEGISAPYSVIKVDGALFWLDNLRRFVMSNGRGFQVVSDPIKSQLDALTTTQDCYGYRAIIDSLDAVIWTFPTDGITFCYEKGSGWSQWSHWNAQLGQWSNFSVTGHALTPDNSTNVVCTSDGKIGELTIDAETDMGQPIRAYVVTGYLNHNTTSYKFCKSVRLALRRGTTINPVGPQATLSFRDRPGQWNDIPIDLGASGDFEVVVVVYALGTYRTRQWKFEYSANEPLALVSAIEEFDVTGG